MYSCGLPPVTYSKIVDVDAVSHKWWATWCMCVCTHGCVHVCYYLKARTRILRPNWWLSVSSWMQLQCSPPPALALWPRKWRLLHRRVWPWIGSGWRTIKVIFPRIITTTLAGQMSCSRMKYWGLSMTLWKRVCVEVSVGVAHILIFLNGRKCKSVCTYYTLLCQEVTRIECPQLVLALTNDYVNLKVGWFR